MARNRGIRTRKGTDADKRRYYREAADFWREAIRLQKTRCTQTPKDPDESRADLNFYVMAVYSLREVARQVQNRLRLEAAKQAIGDFDKAWPYLENLRDDQEHVRGPFLTAPLGIYYFRSSIANLERSE